MPEIEDDALDFETSQQRIEEDEAAEVKAQEQADQDVGQQTPDEEMLPKPGEMSRENAGNILDAVREAEQDAQRERMKKMRKQGTAKGRENW